MFRGEGSGSEDIGGLWELKKETPSVQTSGNVKVCSFYSFGLIVFIVEKMK